MTYKEKWELEHPGSEFSVTNGCPIGIDGYELDCPVNEMPNCFKCWDQEIPEEYEKTNMIEYVGTIKDSGSTTEFDTGAHRDARDGKGRCDLLPLEVVGNFLCDSNDETEDVLWNIRQFQKTNSTSYLYSALECFNQRNWDNAYTLCLEVSKHYEEGGKRYGDNNWKNGMPVHIYIDSAIRHYLKWLRGDEDEPHDRAFVWNLMCCIWEVDYHKEDAK